MLRCHETIDGSMNADSTRTERPDYSPTLLKRIVLPLRMIVNVSAPAGSEPLNRA
jgi:hypothetical protein